MARNKQIVDGGLDYKDFINPYTAIACMILIQAASDLNRLGNRDSVIYRDCAIYRIELEKFFSSEWAAFLAESVGIEPSEIKFYMEGR